MDVIRNKQANRELAASQNTPQLGPIMQPTAVAVGSASGEKKRN
jgi:hypothetical protein